MKKKVLILVPLFLFLQSCMAWPMLTGAVGLAVGKKSGGTPLFFLPSSGSESAITRIELTSQNTSIAKGTSSQFYVTAVFENGTNRDVTSSSTIFSSSVSIAAIEGNSVRGLSVGSSDLEAAYQGFTSRLTISVTPALLNSIQVTTLDSGPLAIGSSRQFSATGIFSDGSNQDLTNDPLTTWSSSNDSIISVNVSGLATAHSSGTVSIRATFASKQGFILTTANGVTLSSIQVTPSNPSVPLGANLQFLATGIYSDNSTQDLTNSVTWTVLDTAVATIGNDGLSQTMDIGSTSVFATLGSKIGLSTLTVTSASLVSISIQPVNSSGAKGLSTSFRAIGILSDNSSLDITDQVVWTTTDPNILAVSNASGSHGLGFSLNPGTVTISALIGGIEGYTDFTVTPAELVSISVTPILSSKAKGLTEQFFATGTYTDNSTLDITNSVTWTSSSSIVSISNTSGAKGFAQTISIGTTIITATFGSISGNTTFAVTSAILTSIQVTPSDSSLAKGLVRIFTATGIYSDASNLDITSSVTWSSSDPIISLISNASGSEGLAFGNEVGITSIRATLGSISSPPATLSVTAAELVSIGITPSSATRAKGLTQNFTATGVFTDHSTQNITEQVTWFSSDTIIAQISNLPGNKGFTNALLPGSSDITATLGSVSSPSIPFVVTPAELISISVTPPNPSVAKGFSQQFVATGTYTDNTTQNITGSVSWSSSNPSKAQISNSTGSEGLASTLDVGNVAITATLGSISGSSNLTISSAVLITIQVAPTNPSVAKGLSKQFTATGIYSDNSTQDLTLLATWSSSDSSKILISNASGSEGLASANALGFSNIIATYGSIQSAISMMTVTPAELVSVVVSPPSPSKPKGLTQQFTANGIFTDSTSQNLTESATWYSSDTNVAPISNATGSVGSATALSTGSTNIYAVFNSLTSNTVSFTVTPAVLVSIQISPSDSNLAKGLSRQFSALGIYSDASSQDITTSVSWSGSNPLSANVSNASGTEGLVSALQIGANTISAISGSISGSTSLTITPATLSSIAVSPTNPAIYTTATKQFTAVGTYSDASSVDLTSLAIWSSSQTFLATVSNAPGTQGLATGIAEGNSIITATYGSVSGSTTLTVNPIDISPPTLISVTSLSPTTIRVVYSENVNNEEALNLSNYKIVNSSSLTGTCSDNSDFSANPQTGDFSLSSVNGSGNTFTIILSSSQISGKTYTLVVDKNAIHDLSFVPNLLGCPNNADFTGQEQLKVSGAVCNSVGKVIVSFSKSVYPGADIPKSAECSNATQCALRYKLTGVSSLGNITSAKILDGTVCGGAPADSSKVCLTHSLSQSGGQYTVIAANNLDGDGFDNMSWGAIRNGSDTENLQSSPKDRTSFIGCGSSPVNFTEGPIANNPFADDSSFGYLTGYNGRIYIGPNTNGNQAVRFNYDGTLPESVSFSFTKDTTSSGGSGVSSNSASSRDGGIGVPPYVTIGHTGCSINNADQTTGCGPDNEDGRGVFSTGSLGGIEHILMAGSRSSENFNYLYYSSDTDSGLDFKYIDMGSITGTVTAGTSSITVMNDRIYSGFAKRNQNTNSPDFGKITFNSSDTSRCTIGNNCNANDGTRGDRFRIDRMPYFGGGSSEGNNSHINWAYYVGIDSLFVFNGRIYAANGGFPNSSHNGSIIRSTNGNPTPCDDLDSCNNWTDVAPRSDSKWHNGSDNNWFSLELTKYYDLIPADKAFSQFAEFNGKLYVTRTICLTPQDNSGLRNSVQTIAGCTNGNYNNRRPQLWKCDPTLNGNNSNCDSGDWSLVGDDGGGFTNFGNVSNHSITMAVRNGSYLYIGFDNESGVQIWRTNVQNPGSASSSWEQIGTNGLGDTNNRQIYSSISGTDAGVNYIYVSVGKNNQPVRVYRQQNN
ncbi:Ig-like domain-containing protein [Leptospira sp. 201903070]|uniref:Ig-like domain-containing protein n=1 Tax=Leptospira ainlahdjerensis TaxID=2810033 RepID=A0ABS2UIN5_9LEPT|nr:Ig-like domain-containing protein [Leptospira ainlahdjerensis]MBM9579257.1 Ig-like domain-containing protein [Leptospira ainlahdjerensis]